MTKRKLTIQFLLSALAVLAMALSACNIGRPPTATEVLEEGGNVIPTPIQGTAVGSEAGSQAAGTPEETFSRFLAASFATLVSQQKANIELRQRYEDPADTEQDLGGLVTDINILEDRTEIKKVNENSTNATAHVDVDVRVIRADGDSESLTCKYDVTLKQVENDNNATVWYVLHPAVFPMFVGGVCRPK